MNTKHGFDTYTDWRNKRGKDPFWHPKFTAAYRRLLACLDYDISDRVTAHIGPSRVGKSLLNELLAAQYVCRPVESPNLIRPFVLLKLFTRSRENRFVAKSFWINALHEVKFPLAVSGMLQEQRDRYTEDHLVDLFGRALTQNRTRWLLIDEAQDILWAPKKLEGAARFLNVLKGFAEEFSISLILSGGPPLLQAIDHAPHLSGRVARIFHDRYRQESDEDLNAFRVLFQKISEMLPISKEVHTARVYAELLEASRGVIGLLLNILDEARNEAKAQGARAIAVQHLQHGIKAHPISAEMDAEIGLGDQYYRGETDHAIERNIASEGSPKNSAGISRKPFQEKPKRRKRGEL